MNVPIRSLAEVTPEWLTQCLNQHPSYRGAFVKSLSRKPCNYVATSGSLYRIIPIYEENSSGFYPLSIILKLPGLQTATEYADYRSFFRREWKFYDEMSRGMESMVPLCFHSAWDEVEGRFHLLLEDCQLHGSAPNWQLGPPIEELRSSVVWLATFHAAWWGTGEASDFHPLQDDDLQLADKGYFHEMWSKISDCFGNGDREACEEILLHWKLIIAAQAHRPKTLCHGDFHPNNIFLPNSVTGRPKAIDWQFCHVGLGISDLADLMTLYVHPHLRKSSEFDMIRIYWETLVQAGVEKYTLEECIADYMMETCKNVLMPFFQLKIPNLPLSAVVHCMRNALLSYKDLKERNYGIHEILGSSWVS